MAAPHKPVVHVVLEQCSLETVKTRTGFELLNCDDHIAVCKKNGKDPSVHRPDIVHQVLLALMDSPLNKAGHLHVLMLTKKNVLIEISPHTRIPRTFKRFCGLMGACAPCRARAATSGAPLFGWGGWAHARARSSLTAAAHFFPRSLAPWRAVQLLHNLKVRAADSNDTLMRVLKSSVTQHIPLGCDVIGLEIDAELLDAYDLPARLAGSSSGGGSSGSSSSSSSSSSGSSSGGSSSGAAAAAAAAAAGAAPAEAAGGAKKGKKRPRPEEGGSGGGAAAAEAAAALPAQAGGSGSGSVGAATGRLHVTAPAAATGAPGRDVAIVIGAMSHGNIAAPYITRTFSLSRYPLSAACTVGKLMNAYERHFGIL